MEQRYETVNPKLKNRTNGLERLICNEHSRPSLSGCKPKSFSSKF